MLSAFSFGLQNSTNLPAGVFCIEIIEQATHRGEIIISFGGIHAIVDGNEADILHGEGHFQVLAYLQIIPSKAAQVLDDDGSHLTRFHQGQQLLHSRAVEVGSGISIIDEELSVPKAVILRIFSQDRPLVGDRIALAFQIIFVGKTAIESGNPLLIHFIFLLCWISRQYRSACLYYIIVCLKSHYVSPSFCG